MELGAGASEAERVEALLHRVTLTVGDLGTLRGPPWALDGAAELGD